MSHDASVGGAAGSPSGRGSAPAPRSPRRRSSLFLATLVALVYVAAAASYPWSKPGLHYDEALLVRDAVQMLATPERPAFSYDYRSWVRVAGRAFPVMDLPYLGAIKSYLMLAPFAAFGTSEAVVRAFAVLIAAVGIWGIVWTLGVEISAGVAAAAGLAMAVHPALLDQTVYDNNVVAVWMATLGAAALAFSRHLRLRSEGSAFLLGFASGFAVWGRLNFLWLLAAVAASALAFVPGAAAELRTRGGVFFGGFAAGAAPVLFYEAWTRFGTLRYIVGSPHRLSLVERVGARLPRLAETLLSDHEHRGIWGGPPLPATLVAFVAAFASAGVLCAVAAPRGAEERASDSAWRRASGLSALLFAAVMLTSGLAVAEHHLVTLVPVAAVAAVLGFRRAATAPAARALVAGATAIVLAAALDWNFRSASEIRRTGGRGAWSDAIDAVAATLRARAPGSATRALSWGLANNTFVLTAGAVCPQETFWDGSATRSPAHRPWAEEIAPGGFFLVGETPVGAAAREGFLRALAGTGARYRLWTFRERGGDRYARLFEIEPAAPARPPVSSPAAGNRAAPTRRETKASKDRSESPE